MLIFGKRSRWLQCSRWPPVDSPTERSFSLVESINSGWPVSLSGFGRRTSRQVFRWSRNCSPWHVSIFKPQEAIVRRITIATFGGVCLLPKAIFMRPGRFDWDNRLVWVVASGRSQGGPSSGPLTIRNLWKEENAYSINFVMDFLTIHLKTKILVNMHIISHQTMKISHQQWRMASSCPLSDSRVHQYMGGEVWKQIFTVHYISLFRWTLPNVPNRSMEKKKIKIPFVCEHAKRHFTLEDSSYYQACPNKFLENLSSKRNIYLTKKKRNI